MNDCMEKIIPEDLIIKFDSLTLNIGEINYNELDEELVPKIIEALEQQLSQQIRSLKENDHPATGSSITVQNDSGRIALLEYFLLNGTLPWWAQHDAGFMLGNIIHELFSSDPVGLRTLIVRIARNEYVRKRLVSQFNEENLHDIIKVLEPSEAAFILGYHKEVVSIQQKEQVVQAETTAFSKAAWLFILTYLLEDRGSDFNRKSFVKSTLVQMAAWFNVNYYELLRVFYEAITIEIRYDRHVSSLETFIRELTQEEEIYHDQLLLNTRDSLPHTAPVKDTLQLSAKADLVVYYLRYGTLPLGVNLYSQATVAEMFAELVKYIPETMRGLLTNIGKSEGLAKRYYALTGQEGGKEFLHILYPGDARLLFTFSSLVELIQEKKHILHAETVSLKQELQNISAQLLFAGDHKDNELLLLRSLIKQLSAAYGNNAQKIITDVHISLQAEFRRGIINSNLPEMVKLLAEELKSHTEPARSSEEERVVEITGEEHGLQDALTYLIQYGHIPWWGKHFFEKKTVDEQLQKLLFVSPKEMMQLLRMAGNEPGSQKRLLSYASLDTLFDIIGLLPPGQKVIDAVKQASHWFEKGDIELSINVAAVSKIILYAVWDELIRYGYQSFSMTGFYSLAVLRLAAYFDTTAHIIASTLQLGLIKGTATVGAIPLAEKEILDDIIRLVSEEIAMDTAVQKKGRRKMNPLAESAAAEKISKDPFMQKIFSKLQQHEVDSFLKHVPSGYGRADNLSIQKLILQSGNIVKQQAARESMDILRHYFVWHTLPAEILIKEKKSVSEFIKMTALLIYAIDPAMLVSLLRSDQFSEPAQFELARLLDINKGGEEEKLLTLIKEIVASRSHEAEEVTGGQKEMTDTTKQGTEIKKLLGAIAPAGQKNSNDFLHAEAVRILEHFFERNSLPAQWKETQDLPVAVFLKQLLLILYKENRSMLQKLLQNQENAVPARIFFHELISESAGGIEKEAALFIRPYKELYQQKILDRPGSMQMEKEINPDYAEAEKNNVGDIGAGADQLVQWIGAFLSTGKFTATADQPFDTKEKLVTAVVQLHVINQPALKRLLEKEDHNIAARIQLHDLFITQTGYREREILQLLQQYWQKDLLDLLASREILVDRNNPADLVKVLVSLLSSGKKGKKEDALWQLAISSPLFVRHLLVDAAPSLLKTLIERTGIGWGTDTADFIQGLILLFEASVPNKLERDKLLVLTQQFNLLFLSGRITIKSRKEYLQAFFIFLAQATHSIPLTVFSGILEYIWQNKVPVTNILAGSLAIVQAELKELINRFDNSQAQKREWLRQQDALADKAAQEERERRRAQQQEDIRKELERERLREEERLKKESAKTEDDKHNKIYIRNAGLVLLHPFLGIYFSRLGLLDKGKFIDEASQHRAVLLLQYLVNGRNESEEFELALNKLLCGLAIEETIPLEIVLTEEEITMSAELFAVIFERWDKMKNTSVEGFRASFLQREGALWREEKDWQLRVEQRTYDMLLQTLPWAFGMIKNTWMTQILTVEWT